MIRRTHTLASLLGFISIAAAIIPNPAIAAGSIGIDDAAAFGLTWVHTTGDVPADLAGPETFTQNAFWIVLRGGSIDSSGESDLGTQLGVEFDLRAGLTP